MSKKKQLSEISYHPTLMILFAINMLIMKWAGIEDTFDYIWYEVNKFGFITNLVLILSDVAKGYISKKYLNSKMNIFASLIISTVVSFLSAYVGCSLMIMFSLFGSFGRMLTLTPTVFFNNYIAGPYIYNIIFWIVYCNIVYLLHYYGKKYSWEEKLAGKFGYVFDENIARIANNTIEFPRDFKYDEMLIYTPGDTRVMIVSKELYDIATEGLAKKETLTEDEIKFKNMIVEATELNKVSDSVVEFDEKAKEFVEKSNYEIIEHEGWYELLPLNLQEKKEEKFSLLNLISSQATFWLVLFGVLTYIMVSICLDGDWYLFEEFMPYAEHLSFFALMVSGSFYCNRFIVNENSTKRKKIITYIVSSVVTLAIIIALNNLYHYISFGVQFNWPKDVTYTMFLMDDITYSVGFGWLRYPAVLLAYSAIYTFTYFRIIRKMIKRLKKLLVELLSEEDDN